MDELRILMIGDIHTGKRTFAITYSFGMFVNSPSFLTTDIDAVKYLCSSESPTTVKFRFTSILENISHSDYNTEFVKFNPHAVVMCYSVGSVLSLESLFSNWAPAVGFSEFADKKVFALGLKSDLSNRSVDDDATSDQEEQDESVKEGDIEKVIESLKDTVEISNLGRASSLLNKNVTEVVEEIYRSVRPSPQEN